MLFFYFKQILCIAIQDWDFPQLSYEDRWKEALSSLYFNYFNYLIILIIINLKALKKLETGPNWDVGFESSKLGVVRFDFLLAEPPKLHIVNQFQSITLDSLFFSFPFPVDISFPVDIRFLICNMNMNILFGNQMII